MVEARQDPEKKGSGVDPILAEQLASDGLESQAPGTGAGLNIQKPGQTAADVRARSEWLLRGEQAADLASYLRLAPKTVLLRSEEIPTMLQELGFNLPMQVGDAVVIGYRVYGEATLDLVFVDKDWNLAKMTIDLTKITSYREQAFNPMILENDLKPLGFRFYTPATKADENFRYFVNSAVAKHTIGEQKKSGEVKREGFDF